MPTGEGAAHYLGRKRASVASSNAGKQTEIRDIHPRRARRFAGVVGVSGSQIAPLSRYAALQFTPVSGTVDASSIAGKAFLPATCLSSDRLLVRARDTAVQAYEPCTLP